MSDKIPSPASHEMPVQSILEKTPQELALHIRELQATLKNLEEGAENIPWVQEWFDEQERSRLKTNLREALAAEKPPRPPQSRNRKM